MTDHIQCKSVVSVAEMARMVGLSRGRFYQLVGTAFPWPVYDIKTRRPYYDAEGQSRCLDVRKRNCGIDGRPVLFYVLSVFRILDIFEFPWGGPLAVDVGGEAEEAEDLAMQGR